MLEPEVGDRGATFAQHHLALDQSSDAGSSIKKKKYQSCIIKEFCWNQLLLIEGSIPEPPSAAFLGLQVTVTVATSHTILASTVPASQAAFPMLPAFLVLEINLILMTPTIPAALLCSCFKQHSG